jgi:hypothetical protein
VFRRTSLLSRFFSEITIVTHRPMPKEGERLTGKGTVREAFSLGSEALLVIEERPEKTG